MSYDPLFQTKIWPVIISELEQHVAPVFGGRLSYKVASSLSQLPVGIYQSQDGGGSNDDTIGANGWTGLLTIRAIDTTLSGAWSKVQEAAAAMLTISHPSYDISVNISNPIELPVEKLTVGSVYTAGIVFSMGVYPKSM